MAAFLQWHHFYYDAEVVFSFYPADTSQVREA
ncbi:hypothetical protein J2W46_006843 [Paraburkholderia strydomiana]|jgi:hypothetical protein|nr:hypothetical protein [Paraburkholderia strydomiana]